MNCRQSLKAATAYIGILERSVAMYKADVKDYYDCIEGTVEGRSICDYCEDLEECQLAAKGNNGCKEWQLRLKPAETITEEDVNGEGKGVHGSGQDSGEGT